MERGIIRLMRIEEKVARLLTLHQKTLSLAESCSGGHLSNLLTNVPGASAFFKLGLIAYSNNVKKKLLKIPKRILIRHGAVSGPVAELMARNVRKLQNTDFGIAITGIAGPTGGTGRKPVGLTYIAITTKQKSLCIKYIFKGSRLRIKSQAAHQALKTLLEFLKS